MRLSSWVCGYILTRSFERDVNKVIMKKLKLYGVNYKLIDSGRIIHLRDLKKWKESTIEHWTEFYNTDTYLRFKEKYNDYFGFSDWGNIGASLDFCNYYHSQKKKRYETL